MNKYDGDFSHVEVTQLIEYEDELNCDIDLYNESIIRLQLSYQRGEKPYKEYMSEFEILNDKIEQLREYRKNLTSIINSRIKEFDNDDIFELDNEEFVEQFYKEIQDGGYKL
ncbi:hypothetical protein AM2_009 [Lactococcus phage AM2]|uniref:Uncharacterized protein n=8 Tax=Audreyjarvisvirus TaxID=2843351 RepID=A0A1W6JLE1_9CAUD|nr:hypothetical protein H1Z30_gp009 [Lactococcus phage AM1]YP_009905156.1 hypothetical protein H1Z34_gp009 [Lactococcus phage LW81]ARM66314.1 hypothetical protein AM2_009 [Lactococcus phage AM2]ARM66491.1 hypothetical protein AM3_009 [Lactococcus phage AM3]ARM67044.1 hypothetical protein AM8_009 [Lactococcus phage AM8]ARM67222.1 hypothetical protein AM9_009 [Lactococcus phage AM9]ARM67401.1 hypothetical protein AM11_009 [Lactococcus phage AM11]ARQ95588.1 hypothetical protein AM12_009 [Lactoc